jgi:hypothetical protein
MDPTAIYIHTEGMDKILMNSLFVKLISTHDSDNCYCGIQWYLSNDHAYGKLSGKKIDKKHLSNFFAVTLWAVF